MIAYLVMKEVLATEVAQAWDVFPKNKFKGNILTTEMTLKDDEKPPTPEQILQAYDGEQHSGLEVVGVMIPKVGAAFKPNHEIYSNGEGFVTVDQLINAYQANA